MDPAERADFLEESENAVDERTRRHWENGLRAYAYELGVMSTDSHPIVVQEADSPSIEWRPEMANTPIIRRGFRSTRGRWYRSVHTQTPGSLEKILRDYLEDGAVEEGRAGCSPVMTVRGADGTFRLHLKNETPNENIDAEFDFADFGDSQPRSPSPESERDDHNDRNIRCPTIEEVDEISESNYSEVESVITNPERVSRRQPSAEIESIENDLLDGESPVLDYGRYRVENRLAEPEDEREKIKDGYRHLTLGELKAKMASKGRRARRVCEHIHELEEAVLFLRASRQHLRKIEMKETVLEELIVSHERMRRRQIGLSDYHLASSSGSLGPYTANNMYGA
ncbi:hypothetical protein V9T40_004139 [Parthenolecanium corni]|uniref:Uncharacterized protein n=1 Tax=Parthenolecanium corni TaxID=536013 RepID=A0AAN9Y2W0_9HEMI